jgi:hypothetical protein
MSIQVSTMNVMLLINDNQATLAAKLLNKNETVAEASAMTARVLEMCSVEQATELRTALAQELKG